MSNKTAKTNAVRILDTHNISYELREYEVDEEHIDALHVAKSLGVNPEGIYKTLVLKGNIEPFLVAVIPANTHLDMKKFAKISGNKTYRNEKAISYLHRRTGDFARSDLYQCRKKRLTNYSKCRRFRKLD